MFGWGPWELIVILVIVLLLFGPTKLPKVGRSLGSAISEFKNSIKGKADSDDSEDSDNTKKEE